jgi:hypothetical protein
LRTSDSKIVKATLENVLYVPSFPQSIFSVRAATDKGAKVVFDGDKSTLFCNGTSFPIIQHGRLYYLLSSETSDRKETLAT